MILPKPSLKCAPRWTPTPCSEHFGLSMDIGSFLSSCVATKVVNPSKSTMVLFALLKFVCFKVLFKVLPFIR